jgi:hypothetical protein
MGCKFEKTSSMRFRRWGLPDHQPVTGAAVRDPERHFLPINCRAAKGSLLMLGS